MKLNKSKRSRRRILSGSARAWHGVVGAPADYMFGFLMFMLELVRAVGEGADCDTRGRVCSPARKRILSDEGHKEQEGNESRINLNSSAMEPGLFALFAVKIPPKNRDET